MKSLLRELNQVFNLLGRGKLPYLVALVTCATIDPLYQITFALVNKRLLNAIQAGDSALMLSSIALMGGVLLFHFTLQPLTAYHYEGRLYYPIIAFKLRLLRHIARVPLAWLESSHSGDLMTRISQDVDELDDFYRLHTYDLVSSALWGVGSLVVMVWLSPLMAAIMIVLGLFTAWGNTAFSRRLEEDAHRERTALGLVNQRLTDIIPGLRVIKSFNLGERFAGDYSQANGEWVTTSLGKAQTMSLREALGFLLSTLSFLGGLVAAAYLVALGSLDFGTALAVILLQNGVVTMFANTGSYYGQIRASLVSVRRILEILYQPEEEQVQTHTGVQEKQASAVLFQNVSFSYPGGPEVLQNFNMVLTRGSRTALAGQSGGGKSTILKLLLGLYRPQEGRIMVEGQDAAAMPLSQLREQVAYVPQNVFLFSQTIAENIRLGCPQASDSDVVEAAKQAFAHQFIMALPEGYSTRVGEGGAGLSGGQRQRLAIARAILKDAPILVLDEATSALDSQAEEEVYKALEQLMAGKTVLTVAHRESSLAWADNVQVVESA